MRLSKRQVNEFQKLYKARFGEEIDYEAAEAEGLRIIRLVSAIQPTRGLYIRPGIVADGADAALPGKGL